MTFRQTDSPQVTTTKVVLISPDYESAAKMEQTCSEKQFDFEHLPALPALDTFQNTNQQMQIFLVLEDCSGSLSKTGEDLQERLVDFLWSSRHHNISIIFILHSIKAINSQKTSFTRSFLSNATCIVCFLAFGSERVSLYKYLRSIITNESRRGNIDKIIDKMFDISSHFSNWPYLLVQPRKPVKNSYLKVRSDVFNNNGIIFNNQG